MCIQTRIQQKIQQKAELDAQIAKLEKLETATAPVKNLLAELLADYAAEAPEDISAVWEEVLAIGQKHNLSVQPLAADELQQWEAVQTENQKLRKEDQETKRQYLELLEVSANRVKELQSDLEKEKYNYSTLVIIDKQLNRQVEDLRSRLAQIQPEVWRKEEVAPELENLYQEALTENTEPETDSIESILTGKGFFQPNDLEDYGDKYETYRGWEIYYSSPNGGIVSIGLYNAEYNQPWDANTECIEEIDPTFPESLADYDEIVAWTRALIDQVKNLEAPGQLSLEFPEPTEEQIEEELGCNWEDEESESAPEPTQLQKLLGSNTHVPFIFERTETEIDEKAYVYISSAIAPADDTVDLESEEARIKVAIGNSRSDILEEREYFVDAPTFAYQYKDRIREVALGYVKHFLQELKKEAEIKEKITKWKVDDAQGLIESVELDSLKTETKFETMGLKVRVHPQPPSGVTFRFLNPDDTIAFATSLLTAEIADRTWKVCAWDLIANYKEKEASRLEKEANPYKKPEDDFVELVKITPAVGYLKRKDNGELLAAYAAFSNRNAVGEKASTFAKVRAKKWATYLHSSFESCGWKVEEPRKISRMEAEPGAKQQFSYEIKITGKFSIGQLQKLAEEDFSLLPNEVKAAPIVPPMPAPGAPQTYRVKVNSYELASGTEEEMRSRFEEELKNLGGSQMSVSLLTSSEVIESYRVNDFEFVQVEGFDTENPEYQVTHLPSQKSFKVYKRLADEGRPELSGWTNTLFPYTPGFTKREAAVADAVRRLLKAERAE